MGKCNAHKKLKMATATVKMMTVVVIIMMWMMIVCCFTVSLL